MNLAAHQKLSNDISLKKGSLKLPFLLSSILFLRKFDKGIKGTDEGHSKVCQHKLFGGLMLSYR
jgi:hypothetical protein